MNTAHHTHLCVHDTVSSVGANNFGVNDRIKRLRRQTFETQPLFFIEWALIETRFYQENYEKYLIPILCVLNSLEICKRKTTYIGEDELIVSGWGPRPKAVSISSEPTCHSVEDLHILSTRELQRYIISQEDIDTYEWEVIPYWESRTQRERIFSHVPKGWKEVHEVGMFTEFIEQRAPGHTASDGKVYQYGLLDLKKRIEGELSAPDFMNNPEATNRQEELTAMSISCGVAILLAERHVDLAGEMSLIEKDPHRVAELRKIAEVCRWAPAHTPRTYWEATQMYWFVHLGAITESNGWDAVNPGHFDQHLASFYEKEIAAGTLTHDEAKESMSCFSIKVNNRTAPPKVGITVKESGTYSDFTNLNIGGIRADGSDGVSGVSYIILEMIGELHISQPGSAIHVSAHTLERSLRAGCKVIRQGHGYPSVLNPDVYVQELMRQGKSLRDVCEGGCSGCIGVGVFGKGTYVLTGYLNVPKASGMTLHNDVDPVSGRKVGLETDDPRGLRTCKELYAVFTRQIHYFVDMKVRVSNYIDCMFVRYTSVTLLSLFIDDCITKGKDCYNCGPRYNTIYTQCTGLGTTIDSLSFLQEHVFEDKTFTMEALLDAMTDNSEGHEPVRQMILNRTPFFGNNDSYADRIAARIFDDLYDAIRGEPNTKGKCSHLSMLPTTCYVYLGKVMGATPNGRLAGRTTSDGTSPSHGADIHGSSVAIKSFGKLDQVKSGGTSLNQCFLPSLSWREEDISKLASLIRSYLVLGGHHIQSSIVSTETLYAAQKCPEDYRGLLARAVGYSDYFSDMNADLQADVIAHTEQETSRAMLLLDIKRYVINDGPGIRVTIFMKGCPLACAWCHNPEGISPRVEKLYTRKKCIGCGARVNTCPTGILTLTETGIVMDRSLCRTCGRCTGVCPTLAMETSGHEYFIDEVMREIEKETVFMDRSGGGVTLCGGEPLSHSSDLIALLDRYGASGIHRVVDMTLFAPPGTVQSVMERTDLFLVNLKHIDSGSHCRFTGVLNERIFSNLRTIIKTGIDLLIRVPPIGGVNVDEEDISRSATFLASLP